MSHHQYGTLKWVADYIVTLDHLRSAKATTLWSLLHRGYITQHGDTILLTQLGEEALTQYKHPHFAERRAEADLTERCLRLLKVSRVIAMRQAHLHKKTA